MVSHTIQAFKTLYIDVFGLFPYTIYKGLHLMGVFLFSLVCRYRLELRRWRAEKLISKFMRDEPKGLSLFCLLSKNYTTVF